MKLPYGLTIGDFLKGAAIAITLITPLFVMGQDVAVLKNDVASIKQNQVDNVESLTTELTDVKTGLADVKALATLITRKLLFPTDNRVSEYVPVPRTDEE